MIEFCDAEVRRKFFLFKHRARQIVSKQVFLGVKMFVALQLHTCRDSNIFAVILEAFKRQFY